MKTRCVWCKNSVIEIAYHDEEWGTPIFDDVKLFEFLILEGAQAGLSWSTILNKRENYRKAFDNFAAEKIAKYSPKKLETLLANPGIIRNRLKIAAAIRNAQAFLSIKAQHKTFSEFIWKFVDGKPKNNHWKSHKQIPTSTKESDAMAKELKKRGFNFVGTTICYAFMQAVGMVNDHTVDCFRHKEIVKLNSHRINQQFSSLNLTS